MILVTKLSIVEFDSLEASLESDASEADEAFLEIGCGMMTLGRRLEPISSWGIWYGGGSASGMDCKE